MYGTQASLVQMKLMFITKLSDFGMLFRVPPQAYQSSEMKHPQNTFLVFEDIMKK